MKISQVYIYGFDGRGQNDLGSLYYSGRGVKEDYDKAFELYTKAAAQGEALAQFNLGEMYYYGDSVSQDYNKAYEWYQKAADQGYQDAQDRINELISEGKITR
ncbi:sel1 repeat family protein [Psychrobacter sp. FME13]|uniref:tetratricopeptide repeat protein n=1 Tax=Psychrobacter sp. AOP1-A1-60 TaxID=3457727 RepID=UPI00178821FC|nr:sel1 repeat family protein [Psychrobacter sp. FME13]